MKNILKSVAMAMLLLPVLSIAAQHERSDYPTRPVRLIVTFAPGASNDILARLIGAKLTDAWGQNIIVDNRAGAGGAIGASTVANAAADGQTLLLANSGPSVGAPWLTRNANYSPHLFTNIVYIGYAPLVRAQEVARKNRIYLALPLYVRPLDKIQPYENKLLLIDPSGAIVMKHFKYGGAIMEGNRVQGNRKLQTVGLALWRAFGCDLL